MNLLSKFVIWLLSPLGTAFCLAGLALLLAWCQRLRNRPHCCHPKLSCHPGPDLGSMDCGSACAMTTLGTLAFVWLWLWSMPVLSLWLRGTIEGQFPQVPIASVAPAQALVVLGGVVSPPMKGHTEIDLGAAADRVWYAARLFHADKAPLVLLSGGGDLERHAFSEARAMAVFAQDLGVPAQAIVLEEGSRNTRQNAALSATLLKARGINHILLVTSALHMPRALALFRAQGLQVIPAPTDFEASEGPPSGLLAWLPDAPALDGSGRAMKELVGQWVGW